MALLSVESGAVWRHAANPNRKNAAMFAAWSVSGSLPLPLLDLVSGRRKCGVVPLAPAVRELRGGGGHGLLNFAVPAPDGRSP